MARAIDKAGMAAGMGLLTSQARGEITGKKFTFNFNQEGMKKVDGDNDKVEILLENKERHQQEKIEIPLEYHGLSRKGEGEEAQEWQQEATRVVRRSDGDVIELWEGGYIEVVRRWDGTIIVRLGQTQIEKRRDGREVVVWPDGTTTVRRRGETELTPGHHVIIGDDGTVTERWDSTGTVIERRSDGTKVTRDSDGHTVWVYSDGTVTGVREVGPGVGMSEFRDPKGRIKPHRKPDVVKSPKESKKLSEKSRQVFYGCDEWGRPQVWIDKDGDGFYDTVRTYDYDGRPTSEIRWRGVTDYQFIIRIYNPDGSYTEYIDTDNDGVMDKKVIVDSDGNSREEPTRTLVVYDPAYQSYDVYSDFDEEGTSHTMESYDKDGRLRQRIAWDENGKPTVETWDANGNPAKPGSWNPARDWAQRARDEFRRRTGIDGNPSPWGGGGVDYEWTQGADGVPRPNK